VWEYSHTKLAQAQRERERAAPGAAFAENAGEDVGDTSEHLRLKLSQWCEAGVGRITQDMEGLEMHSAVRNVMRLFDRIKDFEKRVVARDGEMAGASLDAMLEALAVLAQTLGPFAPHLAEELWLTFGNDHGSALAGEHGAQPPWPGVSLQVSA
jgi:leucyl-tRNA synthetase